MARIRSVHPEQWTDDEFVELSMEARLLTIGLRNFCDDKGCFKWRPKSIKMAVFPADNIDCAPLLEEMERARVITRYEIDGIQYGAVRNFRKYQSPKKPNSIHPVQHHIYEYVGMAPPDVGGGSEPDPDLPPPELPEFPTGSPPVQDQCGKSSPEGEGEGEGEGIGEGGERGSGGKPDNDPPPDDPPKQERARGARLPKDFVLPKDWGDWAVAEGIPPDLVRVEAAKFTDHWHAASGQSASKRDWKAAWRNWIRRAVELNPKLKGSADGTDADLERRMAEVRRQIETGGHAAE